MKKRISSLTKIFNSLINSKKFVYFALILILAGAFGCRLYKISYPLGDWHSWRQADTVSVSRIYLEKGINLLYPRYYDISPIQTGIYNPNGLRLVEFPVFNLLNVVGFNLNRSLLPSKSLSLEEWGRLISILSAVGTTYFLYLLGNKFIGKNAGLLAAFFYAFIPYNIYFTRIILPEPLATFLVIASLWFFTIYVDHQSRVNLFISAVLISLAVLLKPFVLFYFPVFLYLFIKKFGIKALWTKLDIYFVLLIIIAPFCLWRIWINQMPVGIPFSDWLLNGNSIRFRPAFWRWIFGERLGYLILGIWGLPLFVFGILRKNWPVIFSALGMFLYVAVVASGNVQHDYYQTQTIPALALVLAAGVVYLWEIKETNKFLKSLLLIFSLVMMFGMGWYQIKGNYQINHYEIIAAGEKVDQLTPKDAIIIAPYNADTTFLYQTHRFGWPIVDRSFEELVSLGADYFVSVNFDNDTNSLLKKYKAIEQNKNFVIIDLHQPNNLPQR